MTTFFTSDTHFAHAAIIEYCNRPFANVEEMDRELVRRWNARVQPGDTVYHLGDFAFGPVENVGKYLAMLNGSVILVRGNHDRSLKRMREFGFRSVNDHETILCMTVDWPSLFLTHKPTTEHPLKIVTDYHLHGHVHEKYARRGNCINVGVDVRGFAPATLEELLATVDGT